MIDRFASRALIAGYNHLLAREAAARAALAPFAGRSARIDAGVLRVSLAIAPDGQLAEVPGDGIGPDVVLALKPQAIAGALFDPAHFLDPAGAIDTLRGRVHIEGDAAFAQALTDVLARLRPEPAEDLARLLGDAPAERLVRGFSGAIAQLRDAAHRLARQGADFVVSEQPLVVGAQEFARWRETLGALQERLDRLEGRVGLLAGPPRGDAAA